jgi:SAM-dependent methyltransferase
MLQSFIDIAKKDPKAELECKLLSGQIQTKDVADRMMTAIQSMSGQHIDSSLLRVSYDDIRVEVEGPHNIQKVCATNAFRGVPLLVQKKTYYDDSKNTLDVPDVYSRFTLRLEKTLRKDWDASPNDPKTTSVRIINRRSFMTADEFFRIDFSMVKSRKNKKNTLREVLKEIPSYELEIEFVRHDTQVKTEVIEQHFFKMIRTLLQAFQESEFPLTPAEQDKYIQEFKASQNIFVNPVTLKHRHLTEKPHNILKGYTVTNKADGERSGLYVARDKRVVRITSRGNHVTWTGLTALTETFHGTFVDGEYIKSHNLFAIFDIYHYKGRSTTHLPLMKTDEDTQKSPLNSRLGCANLFVQDIASHFTTEATHQPLKIETKLFLAGDGMGMQEAIQRMLEMKYEYETDGLIFTPRLSSVAPKEDRKKNTWLTVYKWKPPHQNSIDFLLKLSDIETYDPVLDTRIRKGDLYVSRSSSDTVLYPCETMTGEYVPRDLPTDLKARSLENPTYIPSPFQPSSPQTPNAYEILVPLKDGLPVDEVGQRIEDSTIIECSYNIEKQRWTIMRTRYDKTYEYKVLRRANYGNDRATADDIWSSIHIPVSEEMIKKCASEPIDDYAEEEVYYKEDLDRKARALQDSYNFNNKVKDLLYSQLKGGTLLEIGSGVGGDMLKWKRAGLTKVVGFDPSLPNLKQACVRYLDYKSKYPSDTLPAVLYVQGDMTQPLYDQDNKKVKILNGEEKGSTSYLEKFEGLKKFDAVSAQFVIHYACESEDVFKSLIKNVTMHGDTFIGTCLDGKAVYQLLAGKKSHLFTNGKLVGGEFVKEYEDRESWTDEFGMAIRVTLESFETKKEYLVPFDKVVSLFKEEGFDLKESTLFSDIYPTQKISLTSDQQTFSFLNRTFVFVRGEKPKKEEVPMEVPVEVAEETPKKTRKLKKGGDPLPEVILFHQAGADAGEYNWLSNMAEYPIQIEDKKYPTVEHYYQAMKAHEFEP